MTVFGGEYKERICTIKVLFALDSADAVGVTVCEEVLARWMAPICETFEEGGCFADEIVALLKSLFDLEKIARGVGRDGEGL